MPPRKNIVKSGNAGTSSKAEKPKTEEASTSTPGPPPLFPPGSKTPLALLYERCQKNGWEKPDVQTFRRGDMFSAAVFIHRKNPRTSNKETIKLEAYPAYETKTLMEAKHWAATHALYRFCNNIQLNRVLPTGPREYWQQLAEEHRLAPDHLKWQYDPDPFAAKMAVEERQRKAKEKSEKPLDADEVDLGVFDRGMEARMGSNLRDRVEATIKKVIADYPEVGGDGATASYVDDESLNRSLGSLGFKKPDIRSALEALSTDSPFTTSLLSTLPPLDAALEYLLLHTPEADLPLKFKPSSASSNAFVSSAHAGQENLQRRWMEDRAVKDAGYPRIAVKEAFEQVGDNFSAVFEVLLQRLLGLPTVNIDSGDFYKETRDIGRDGEREAVQSVFPDATFDPGTSILSVPLATVPATLNVIYADEHPYPDSTRLPPYYITSSTLPPYLRLHLTAVIAQAVSPNGERFEGEGICFNAIEAVEAAWIAIEESGPPKMDEVLRNLLPVPPVPVNKPINEPITGKARPVKRGQGRDTRTNDQILKEFENLRSQKAYKAMEEQRSRLPAWASQREIVQMIQDNQVIIVVGETGCGKTTQLPQFVLDAEVLSGRGATASIIVTQPRRVSVLGVSARVDDERIKDGSVGYAIRGESRVKPTTKLLFCTTGVLLRRLASGDELSEVSHIIVDEVHERSVDSDFLLIELREMMKANKRLKVILMSATINQKTFSDYFGGAPVIEIPGRTFPVETSKYTSHRSGVANLELVYLEEIIPTLDYRPPPVRGGERFTAEQSQSFRGYFEKNGISADVISKLELLRKADRIDYQLVAAVVKHIVDTSERGAILIFMPGVQEIRQCIEALHAIAIGKTTVLPLHANLSNDEQKRVFSSTPGRKIVVSTNVAETSITIDDVIYVVDGGKVKENEFDPESGLSCLEEKLVTRASANQRKGRAGRTQPGKCYRLFTRRDEENTPKFSKPEIQRVPLESLTLHVKVTRPQEDAKLYLLRAIDPPKIEAMQQAWETLEQLGAVDYDGNLTALGRHMAMIPLDLRLSKILILGTLFKCLSPAVTIAACLSSKPLFLNPMEKREEANKARLQFSTENSDLLASVNAFDQCRAKRNEGKGGLRGFCEENFISSTVFRDISSLRTDFISCLSDIGFIPFGIDSEDSRLNSNKSNMNLVKAVIVGGLWPRIAKVVLPKAMFDKIAAGSQQREHQAKEVKYFDQTEGRVFIHPSSVLFSQTTYKSRFLAYFTKVRTSKVFLRDVTEVPIYGLLLFGGDVRIKHITGGVSIGSNWIQLKSAPRIGVLINQLRRLLDAQMQEAIESADLSAVANNNAVIDVMLALLSRDGLDPDSL
ncbi:hypothetical protein M408DRAFT_317990 [Serendipita vermifera MAFF 305830]|uniref:RNA helicase n=1 Tax=Serendipita vermifera MAFF 305830 TaxID=933852 RepID=A0A0C3B4G2_SERVB|nr:hypothetical protein M408DRAFT_317990 [Serendipita vermifera MAFF 305830]